MNLIPEFDQKDQIYPLNLDPRIDFDWSKIQELLSDPRVTKVDEIQSQVIDLIKSNHPEKQLTKNELEKLANDFFLDQDRDKYGRWFYFSWKYCLVHVLAEEDFIRVRTIRNNYKITPTEQNHLRTKKIGIVGLSVGQSVALAMTLERSCGEMRLADFDTLELSNLNRIKAGITSLGLEKLVIAAREISEIDPYLKLTLFREGITKENIDQFISTGGQLDLMIDECDSFDIKLLIREKCKGYQVPVMMETSDRGMLDVERFDLEPDRKIFHGFLGEVDPESIKNLSNSQKVAFGLKITGIETLSPRMKASLLEVGQSITSWPQLASGVFLGGATIAHIGRKLLLDDPVPSGRFYVDLDDIIPVSESEFSVPTAEFSLHEKNFPLPNNIIPSEYPPSQTELLELVTMANQAPSGGNIQPWIWLMDRKKVLHLFHDQARSHSLLDFKGTGSLIAFGAALENFRLAAAKMGLVIEVIHQIQSFEEVLIASIRFISKRETSVSVPHGYLSEAIGLRCTSRKNPDRILLNEDQLSAINQFAGVKNMALETLSDDHDLEALAKIIGGMDRMRLFHEQGLKDFIHEVRWSDKEAFSTKDGIDIATLELSNTEKAAMSLLKDHRTVSFFRKFLMGYGLTKISKDTITKASAMFLLNSSEYTPEGFLNSGKVLQQIWLWANLNGLSFQPVTASLFIFHKVALDKNHGFTPQEEIEIRKLKDSFNSLFNKGKNLKEIFMFRINFAGEPSMRSYRRNVLDTLKVLD